MKKILLLSLLFLVILSGALFLRPPQEKAVVDEVAERDWSDSSLWINPLRWWEPWTRPEGPIKIALQVGHENQQEVAAELDAIRNNTGTSGGGFTEVEVNRAIVLKTKEILDQYGYTVEILSATIEPKYWADVFVSIHADGSTDKSSSGYKVAAARMDVTGKAERLASILSSTYGEYVDLPLDPNVTRNMRGYYAFNWRRYEHAVHPMTTSAIVETGFLTNASDRAIIAKQPEIPAEAIAEGIRRYVVSEYQL